MVRSRESSVYQAQLMERSSLFCLRAVRRNRQRQLLSWEVYQGQFPGDEVQSASGKSMTVIGRWPMVSFPVTMMSLLLQENPGGLRCLRFSSPSEPKIRARKPVDSHCDKASTKFDLSRPLDQSRKTSNRGCEIISRQSTSLS